jgi:hypothetical protein
VQIYQIAAVRIEASPRFIFLEIGTERQVTLFELNTLTYMKYLDLLLATDWLSRYYPKYYGNELMLLADDIIKWFQGELPEDSSTLKYLKSLYDSPNDALRAIWKEMQLLTGHYWGN